MASNEADNGWRFSQCFGDNKEDEGITEGKHCNFNF